MANRLIRTTCVVVVAALTAPGCGIPKKRTGRGTNLESLDTKVDVQPPGQAPQ